MASFQMSFQVGRGPARPAMELIAVSVNRPSFYCDFSVM